jgi:hypothetical protein
MKFTTFRPLIAGSFIVACAIAFTVYASQASGSATSVESSAEYRNEQFQFSLLYPADMAVTENNEAGGAQSITFASASTEKQFVILAIPYSQVDIAAGEYAAHDPYGTEDQGLQLRNVDLIVGDTPQFLFVKSGVMYDVVTMKGDEKWLVDILKTWQFD